MKFSTEEEAYGSMNYMNEKTLQNYTSTDARSPSPYPRNRILKKTHKLVG
jgi:hypothetical protein